MKESAVMKSESKEIKECIKELDACYDKLYKRFCEGKFCAECPLDVLYGECMEPNDDYEGLVYDDVPDFEIEANIEPLRKLIEKTKPKYVVAKIRFRKNAPQIEAYLCPSCGAHVSKSQKFCQNCTQSIDWSKSFWRHGNEFTAYEDYLKEGEQEEN